MHIIYNRFYYGVNFNKWLVYVLIIVIVVYIGVLILTS